MMNAIFMTAAMLGTAVLFFSFCKYAWDKRRGGANPAALTWGVMVGGLLAGPGVLIPALLKIADAIINFISVPLVGDTNPSASGNGSDLADKWKNVVDQKSGGSSSSSTPSASPHASASASASPSPSSTSASSHSSHFDSGLFLTIAAIIGLILLAVIALAVTSYFARSANARRNRHARLMERVAKAHSIGEAAETRWLVYDKDMAALLAAPAMRMWSDPKTMAAVEAMGAYDKVKSMVPSRGDEPEYAEKTVVRIETAAEEFEKAMDAAERNAKGLALSTMPEDERNALRRAQAALNIALDPAATEAERERALHVVRSTLERLEITPKENLMLEIETSVRKAIEAPKTTVTA